MPKAAGTGTGGDARRPVATGDARFTDKMPPLQQALFNISATEKAATPVIPPADDNAFNGSLSDETAVMAWLKKRIAVQLRLSDPASLHPNRDLLQLGMDSLLFLNSVAIFSTTGRTHQCGTGVAGSVSSWTHAAYLF